MRKNKGITLIALVITIIVLLILAGISVVSLTGQNGVLTKVSTAKEETKKAEYKEVLELIGNGLKPEKVIENLSTKEFMDRYEKAIREKAKQKGTLEDAIVERKSDEKIWVTTQEGYVYEITENEVKLLGQKGKNPPPNLQQTDLTFKLTPNGYTNQNITVEIIPKINIEGFTLKYKIDDEEKWKDYTKPFTMKENGSIHAKLVNNLEEEGAVATKEINRIDREFPNEATVQFSSTTTDTENAITATVTQSDKGTSGVNYAKCRWEYSTNSGSIGTNPASYPKEGTFSKSPQVITLEATEPGSYYLHVLTIDKAGNPKEAIKGPITVTKAMAKVGVIVEEKNKEYEKNGTAIVPVGFAIVPGSDDVSQGLVISDVANDTGNIGNQFVWIPVTDGNKYVRNATYPDYPYIASAYDDTDYLPSGVLTEKQTVVNAGGFYIARYETGQGLVSKKGATVWNVVDHETAKTQAKNFKNNNYVKSALISGIQWDVTMAFVNGKTDGTGKTFNVTVGSSTRQIINKDPLKSGQNEADRVCNIYDLEGNYRERIAERVINKVGTHYNAIRGGKSGGSSVAWSACYRYLSGAEQLKDDTFRMVLYVM